MQLSKELLLGVAAIIAMPAVGQEAADTAGYNQFRFGGYGEMLASYKNYSDNHFGKYGAVRTKRGTIEVPRAVLAFDAKFTQKWILGIEVEFEAGGTGTALELENSENGEYETEIEKGGEVALEQLHVTRLIIPEINVRAGHLILPLGLTNSHHEPINFFGTSRPEAETSMLPSTWHATGLELFGTIGHFNYQALITAGLNANGFSRDEWVAPGKQGLFEKDNFTAPGYTARVDYTGVKGLRTGVSAYWCGDAGANADKEQHYSAYGKIPVKILTYDAQYRNRYMAARGNFMIGSVENSKAVNMRNGRLPNASPYARKTPVGSTAMSYGAEVGVNLKSVFGVPKMPTLYPFVRYEYFNPQYRVAKGYSKEERLEVSKWSVGVNWFALPNLVIKADYCHRARGTQAVFSSGKYNSESEISIGLAYIGWFISK